MQGRIKRWGNSASVRIPSAVMQSAGLALDDVVDVREEDGRIVIEPAVRTEFDLEEMVAGITPENRHEEISFGPPIGREQL